MSFEGPNLRGVCVVSTDGVACKRHRKAHDSWSLRGHPHVKRMADQHGPTCFRVVMHIIDVLFPMVD